MAAWPHRLWRWLELEHCWPLKYLASSEATLRQRLEAHPTGQLVAVGFDGKLLGAVYTQRVASYDSLLSTTRDREHELHMPTGPVMSRAKVTGTYARSMSGNKMSSSCWLFVEAVIMLNVYVVLNDFTLPH